MSLLAPLGLVALLAVPLVVLLWLLHARLRTERVPSLLLWFDVPAPVAATRAWRWPRLQLLLLLQLAAVLALALALGRPAIDTVSGRHVALVLDRSVSLQATDVQPSRFDAARAQLNTLLDAASPADEFDLILAGARPVVAVRAERPPAIRAALIEAAPEDRAADLATAVRVAASPGVSEVIVATDGAQPLDLPPQSAPVSFKLVGGSPDQLALSDVSLRPQVDGSPRLAGFASVANFSAASRSTTVQIIVDSVLIDAQPLTLEPSARTDITFVVPLETRTLRVALADADSVPADKRIDLAGPSRFARTVLVVADDPSLWSRALAALPLVTVRTLTPAAYRPPTSGEIVLFDGFLPPDLPDSERILVNPPPGLDGLTRTGTDERTVGQPELDPTDPLLRGVDLAGLVVSAVGRASIPRWATLTTGTTDDFLVGRGVLGGRRTIVLAFDVAASNLPRLAAFPLLAANALDWLTPGRGDIVRGGLGQAVDVTPHALSALPAQAGAPHIPAWLDLWPYLAGAVLLLLVAEAISAARRGLLKGAPLACSAAATVAVAVALAQPGVWLPDRALTVVLAVDRSASISPAGQAVLARWLDEARRTRPSADRLGAVMFASYAGVMQTPSLDPGVLFGDVTEAQGTNLAQALRTAAALAREQPAARVVLLSDGHTTDGDLSGAIDAVADVPVDVVPLDAPPASPAVVLETLDLPPAVRVGEPVDAALTIGTTDPTNTTLHISLDGGPTRDQAVSLAAGHNHLAVSLGIDTVGFHRLNVRTDSASLESFVSVKPAERVLLVEERPGEAIPVLTALRATPGTFDARPPSAITTLASLDSYDAVVLANVSATSLTLDQQRTLRSYVVERGRGLVAIGGQTSFVLGNYENSTLEQILPVISTIPPRREDARLALLLVIDISQSMDRVVEGVSGIDMAKQAAVLATRALRDDDQVGVLIFNHRFSWLQPIARLGDIGRDPLETAISSLTPSGGTEIFAALDEGATRMRSVTADLRQIVLFTDGNSRDANYDALTAQLGVDKIGLSTVGLGPEADTKLLAKLARDGQGRFYYSDRPSELPRILAREVAIAKRSAVVEGAIQPRVVSPSPILRSIAPDEIPSLGGYITTTPRPTAQVVLATVDDKPLLAQWRIGLGRTAAWTSDVGGPWTRSWADWPHNAALWQQAVSWAVGAPVQPDFLLDVTASGATARVTLDDVRDDRFVDLASPVATIRDGAGVEVTMPLRQSAPGRYEASVVAGGPGVYAVTVADGPRLETSGFVVRTQPEQVSFAADQHTLRRIASDTGGRVLTSVSEAFRDEVGTARNGRHWQSVWPLVLTLGLLLFLAGLALRRFGWPLTSVAATVARIIPRRSAPRPGRG